MCNVTATITMPDAEDDDDPAKSNPFNMSDLECLSLQSCHWNIFLISRPRKLYVSEKRWCHNIMSSWCFNSGPTPV